MENNNDEGKKVLVESNEGPNHAYNSQQADTVQIISLLPLDTVARHKYSTGACGAD